MGRFLLLYTRMRLYFNYILDKQHLGIKQNHGLIYFPKAGC